MNIPDEAKKKIENEARWRAAQGHGVRIEDMILVGLLGYRLAKSEAVPEYPDPKIKAAADIFEADDDERDARKYCHENNIPQHLDGYVATAFIAGRKDRYDAK